MTAEAGGHATGFQGMCQTEVVAYCCMPGLHEAIMATDKSDWRSRDFENDDGHPPNSMPFVQCVADA